MLLNKTDALSIFLTSILWFASAWAECKEPPKAFCAEYVSRPFGKLSILVCKDAVRFDIKARDTFAIAKAPDWKVHAVNRHARLIFETPLDDFSRINGPVNISKLEVTKKRERLGDLEVTKLSFPIRTRFIEIVGTLDKRQNSLFTQRMDYRFVDVGAPPQACKLVNSILCAPDFPQLYVDRQIYLTNGERIDYVTCVGHHDKVIAPSDFAWPSGYKQVNDWNQLLTGRVEEIEDMIREIGVGDQFGKH